MVGIWRPERETFFSDHFSTLSHTLKFSPFSHGPKRENIVLWKNVSQKRAGLHIHIHTLTRDIDIDIYLESNSESAKYNAKKWWTRTNKWTVTGESYSILAARDWLAWLFFIWFILLNYLLLYFSRRNQIFKQLSKRFVMCQPSDAEIQHIQSLLALALWHKRFVTTYGLRGINI